MRSTSLQVEYPGMATPLEQDEEYFDLVTDTGKERFRMHEYDRLFTIPGLYEEVVYNKLQCESPQVITTLLKKVLGQHGAGETPLRVLDFGAGNGIVGQCMQRELNTALIVGVDIIEEARQAQKRDRPGVYDEYCVMDLSRPDDVQARALETYGFNTLVTVAALGFGDIPTRAFVNAFNLVADHSWVVFNIKERFFSNKDQTGFNQTLQEMIGNSLKVYVKHRYCHRLSITGEPLHYFAVVGRKEDDF